MRDSQAPRSARLIPPRTGAVSNSGPDHAIGARPYVSHATLWKIFWIGGGPHLNRLLSAPKAMIRCIQPQMVGMVPLPAPIAATGMRPIPLKGTSSVAGTPSKFRLR